ncbi:MAG: vitamin B12/bleomycin/antimicrobial peptide transport system ATP-binding/permease protein [Alphaproteobacteria bacterium]|nr:vitamin B12/bleomycin/antimicrobial peptide transport system ATP-binding/permease protein [Alphaproteobacteria bacterium]
MPGFVSTLSTIWRLAIPYFRSEDRLAGRVLLASIVAMELGVVAITVLINQWNARFYNALQDRAWDAFVREISIFCLLAGILIVVRVYQLYLNQWLQIRWRRFLTVRYLEGWLGNSNHYRMQMLGDAADNPDQRIAEDVKQFIDGGSNGVGILPVGLGLLNSVVTLVSFFVILWTLSNDAQLTLFGWKIPGFLFWAALLYAIAGTLLTHLIGRALTALNFNQQRFEADFRFNLVRARENSEQIALLHGETAERGRLIDRFSTLVANWLQIMVRTKYLSFFTVSYSQVSIIFPYVVVAPAYFASTIQLGGLMQTASAFSSVQDALSFFVSVYRQFAEWRAVIERLAGFEASIENARTILSGAQTISLAPGSAEIRLDHLDVALPGGQPIVSADGITIAPRDQVLVSGPSGSGKSTLFRAIAGIWPFGSGKVSAPADGSVMTLPQRPYLPIGSLADAIRYPALGGSYDAAQLRGLLKAVGLPALADRLDEEAHWSRMLSLGEQQRIGVARAILHAPDFLLLDEATASLDEPSEAALYQLLHERLPAATIVSIGHRSTLAAFHKRRLTLTRDGDRYRLNEANLEAVAEPH